jgi:C4-dicarboxylate-specific signal transduction histidine kinase
VTTTDSTSSQQRERQFVAAVCASLSHEIKNCLAIINENAGLMGDLAMLATQGRPVDPERHTRIAQAVKKHVRRADQLVRHLNQFAHSGDVASRELDLADTICFAVTLFERSALKVGRRLTTACGEGLMVETAPLGLLQLLWGLFSAAVAGAVDEQVLVEATAHAGLAQVSIKTSDSEGTPPLLSESLFELARSLGGELKQSAAAGISLALPLMSVA